LVNGDIIHLSTLFRLSGSSMLLFILVISIRKVSFILTPKFLLLLLFPSYLHCGRLSADSYHYPLGPMRHSFNSLIVSSLSPSFLQSILPLELLKSNKTLSPLFLNSFHHSLLLAR
jgi:hypothetical protein